MQIDFLHLGMCMWLGFIYSFILSLEITICRWGFIEANIACCLKKSFIQVALDIKETWPVCCCFISFEKTAWLWSLEVTIFVLFGFERTKMCCWDCLWRGLEVEEHPKFNFQFFTFTQWLMVCSLKSLKVLKSGNLRCVAGKLIVTNSN